MSFVLVSVLGSSTPDDSHLFKSTSKKCGVATFDHHFQLHQALAVGLILSLSSTAIVLQTLREKGIGVEKFFN